MSTATQPAPAPSRRAKKTEVLQVIVYGHSALFYWWPLWVVGAVMTVLTSLHHDRVMIGNAAEIFHTSRNLGVIYTLLLLLLIVITSTNVRGMRAALIIVGLSFATLLFAYFNWWDNILGFLSRESIYMNRGFYLFSSTVLCVIWLLTVFVIDHLSFWRFRPGRLPMNTWGGSWIRVMTPTT